MLVNEAIQGIKSGLVDTVDKWDEMVAVEKFPLETQIDILIGAAVLAPECKVLLRTLYAKWKKQQYHHVVTKAVEVDAEARHTGPSFRVDDILFLVAKVDAAEPLLSRWGHWWKFKLGYSHGTHCLLQSLGKQKRTEPKTKVEQLVIGRAGDPLYDVTNVIQFPCTESDIPK